MSVDKNQGLPDPSPPCRHEQLERRLIRDEFDYGPEEDRIRIVAEGVPVLACPTCGEIFYGPEGERAHHRAICKALGLLTPEEIKGIRERFGKSQAEFAELTGIGVATLSRWERGRLLQTRALDRYLRILDAEPGALAVLEGVQAAPAAASSPWRSLTITAELQIRRARFRLYASAQASAGAQVPARAVESPVKR